MKIMYAAGAVLLIAVAVGAYFIFRGDPLTEALNKRWPPVSIDQQREKAVDTAAAALNEITIANFGTGTDLKTIGDLISPLLKPQGVSALRLRGDREMLRLEADFDRTFAAADL